MRWIDSLKGLPLPVGILVIFTVCLAAMLRSIFKRVVDPLTKSHEQTAEVLKESIERHTESLTKSLDENTEAVRQATKHNEEIIGNHLSKAAKRDAALIREMREVVTSIEIMNSRHRSGDKD